MGILDIQPSHELRIGFLVLTKIRRASESSQSGSAESFPGELLLAASSVSAGFSEFGGGLLGSVDGGITLMDGTETFGSLSYGLWYYSLLDVPLTQN
jgi:hypothetical protein